MLVKVTRKNETTRGMGEERMGSVMGLVMGTVGMGSPLLPPTRPYPLTVAFCMASKIFMWHFTLDQVFWFVHICGSG